MQPYRRYGVVSLLALLSGCASPPPPAPPPAGEALAPAPPAPPPAGEALAPAPAVPPVPVIRHGRYTLVELGPIPAQKDLLLQVIDVAMPEAEPLTVGDALRRVLLRSGYTSCSGGDIAALNEFPLPAAHYRLGPMTLLDALLTLTGPAWQLHIDRSDRRICVTRVMPRALAPLPAPADAMPSAPAPSEPPFRVLGLVSHGGERFVSIQLAGTEASGTRVMRLGETAHGWRLIAIDDEGATFRRGDRVCRVAVP